MSETEELTNSQGIPIEEWEAQQNLIDHWVSELSERLKLDEETTGKALVDWVYVNTDTDWLEMAAKENSLDHQGYPRPKEGYPEELKEFITLASRAWHKAWGEPPPDAKSLSAEEVLETIRNLIETFEQ